MKRLTLLLFVVFLCLVVMPWGAHGRPPEYTPDISSDGCAFQYFNTTIAQKELIKYLQFLVSFCQLTNVHSLNSATPSDTSLRALSAIRSFREKEVLDV